MHKPVSNAYVALFFFFLPTLKSSTFCTAYHATTKTHEGVVIKAYQKLSPKPASPLPTWVGTHENASSCSEKGPTFFLAHLSERGPPALAMRDGDVTAALRLIHGTAVASITIWRVGPGFLNQRNGTMGGRGRCPPVSGIYSGLFIFLFSLCVCECSSQ
ncbi:hypothetical protein CEXT_744661 [Caerostris extrusa]|uniref:Secreted protein n=1 Tax=Caerostris extrusa TaxID=172846 RepID=A0AAV4Y1Y6_CAEEX|nr:hypothetical protein CEXT_744661 [Caerostris extrusa]